MKKTTLKQKCDECGHIETRRTLAKNARLLNKCPKCKSFAPFRWFNQ